MTEGRVGIANDRGETAVVDLAANYARERKQFGKPIGANQAIAHMLADMHTQVEAARTLCVTINPVSAYGWKFDKEEFKRKMSEAVDVPVINVKEELA